jgi:hypothetical protein
MEYEGDPIASVLDMEDGRVSIEDGKSAAGQAINR